MASNSILEFRRGRNEAAQQLALLRKKWPKGFPPIAAQVRPLAHDTVQVVAREFGWSLHYTRGVMMVWKRRVAYNNAIMLFDTRFKLDGSPTDEPVDARARELAKEQLVRVAEKRALQQQELQATLSGDAAGAPVRRAYAA